VAVKRERSHTQPFPLRAAKLGENTFATLTANPCDWKRWPFVILTSSAAPGPQASYSAVYRLFITALMKGRRPTIYVMAYRHATSPMLQQGTNTLRKLQKNRYIQNLQYRLRHIILLLDY
jgi:hypothetical protein